MLIAAAIGGYVIAWLYFARRLYGRWRAKGIDKTLRDYPNLCRTAAGAVEQWNDIDRIAVMLGALILALIWPLIPAFALLARFMQSSPVLSQTEMRERVAERDRRIAELEREAGIRP